MARWQVGLSLFLTVFSAQAEWHFRGEPNGWGASPMQQVGEDVWQIIQPFGINEDEFKIAHESGWDRSFPALNQLVAPGQTYLISFHPAQQSVEVAIHTPTTWVFRGTPNAWQETPMQMVEPGLHMLCQTFQQGDAFAGPRFKIASAEQGWDEAFPETDIDVAPNTSVNITFNELTRQIRVEPVTNCAQGSNPIVDKDALVLHSEAVFNVGVDFSFERFLQQLVDQSMEPGLTPLKLFRQFWDVQNTRSEISLGPNCGDETLADGSPAVNGFPYVCDRREGALVRQSDAIVETELRSYRPIAAINRFDLHESDFQDCGEARMIFARSGSRGFGRNFIIAEARLPNPQPGEAVGCSPLQNAWLRMATFGFDQQAALLEKLYFTGLEGFAPIFSIEHFAEASGQIRTNQFIASQWLLREHKLAHQCEGLVCTLRNQAVSTKENPFGALFNGHLPSSDSEFAERAALFQDQFIERLGSLLASEFADVSIKTDDIFNIGQSHASGPILENQFNVHFQQGQNSDFFFGLTDAMGDKVDALGEPLSTQQVLNRATALTCGGCHQPSTFGLTRSNALGALRLPNGDIIDSWPRSNGFVHISELPDREGVFTLSPALREVFLPIRKAKLEAYLQSMQ